MADGYEANSRQAGEVPNTSASCALSIDCPDEVVATVVRPSIPTSSRCAKQHRPHEAAEAVLHGRARVFTDKARRVDHVTEPVESCRSFLTWRELYSNYSDSLKFATCCLGIAIVLQSFLCESKPD